MDKKPKHLKAIEAIDEGLAAAEQISIEDGIREGIKAGRLTEAVGRQCLDAYRRASAGLSVVADETPETPTAGWSNGVVTLRQPVESGWDLNPEPPEAA